MYSAKTIANSKTMCAVKTWQPLLVNQPLLVKAALFTCTINTSNINISLDLYILYQQHKVLQKLIPLVSELHCVYVAESQQAELQEVDEVQA